jgi:DNA-directed RNA polymerase specialized sigma24 family protein
MPDGDGRYAGLATLLDARDDALLKTAVLLAAGREGGEDLLQEALERLLRKWRKVGGDPESYPRRIMYNRAVDGWRRKSRRPEVLGLPPEITVADHVPMPARERWQGNRWQRCHWRRDRGGDPGVPRRVCGRRADARRSPGPGDLG